MALSTVEESAFFPISQIADISVAGEEHGGGAEAVRAIFNDAARGVSNQGECRCHMVKRICRSARDVAADEGA